MKTLLCSLAVTACVLLLGTMCLANTLYLNANADASYIRTSGPTITSLGGGFNQWSATFQVTNTSSSALPLYWYWTSAFTQDPSTAPADLSKVQPMTWDNGLQQWQLQSVSSGLMTAETLTPANYIAFSDTNLPFPSTGFAATDSLPAYFLGVIPSGGSVTFTWNRKLSDNNFFYFNGLDFLTTVPEPSSLLLLGSGLLGWLGAQRRNRPTRLTTTKAHTTVRFTDSGLGC